MSALVCVLLGAGAALAQTTAFTYQGQLTDAGQPANGSFDLQFKLFDTAVAGTQIGSTQTVSAAAVNGGILTVQLDFGTSAFPGANRFLEIGVRPAGGGSFTTLAPRQQISSTPYAIRTLSAATADALSSACVGCVTDAQIGSVAGSKVTGTIPAAGVPTGSGNYVQNTTAPQGNANFNISPQRHGRRQSDRQRHTQRQRQRQLHSEPDDTTEQRQLQRQRQRYGRAEPCRRTGRCRPFGRAAVVPRRQWDGVVRE